MGKNSGMNEMSFIDMKSLDASLKVLVADENRKLGKVSFRCFEKLFYRRNDVLSCTQSLRFEIVDILLEIVESARSLNARESTHVPICLVMWSILVDCNSWNAILVIEVRFL